MVGVVLAGGASRRMGRDKALLRLDGERLVDRAIRRLAVVCDEVLVADRGRGLVSGRPSVADGPGAGPGAGLLGAARQRPSSPLLALACDLPAVGRSVLEALVALPGDLCLPRWQGGIEPLCALYRPPALVALARRMAAGEWAPRGLCDEPGLEISWLEGPALEALGPPAELFANLNRPKDLESWAR